MQCLSDTEPLSAFKADSTKPSEQPPNGRTWSSRGGVGQAWAPHVPFSRLRTHGTGMSFTNWLIRPSAGLWSVKPLNETVVGRGLVEVTNISVSQCSFISAVGMGGTGPPDNPDPVTRCSAWRQMYNHNKHLHRVWSNPHTPEVDWILTDTRPPVSVGRAFQKYQQPNSVLY